MATDEMRHSNLLHDEVTKKIEAKRKERGEVPLAMMAVWEYLHEKHIEQANRVKMYQSQYRGG